MILDQAIILCAGLGTRLERISKKIPKAMLPLFDKRLVDIQIEFLRKQGIGTIYVNVHHFADDLERHLRSTNPGVRILKEDILLGSGGVFHNLKKMGIKGKVLAINVDTLYFTERSLADIFSEQEDHQLLSMACEVEDSYNRLLLDDDDRLINIVPPDLKKSSITFSGMSLINLDKLQYIEGVSSFFSTVCVPNDATVIVIRDFGHYEFYDFGTVRDYANSYKTLTSQILDNQGLWKRFFPEWSSYSLGVESEHLVLNLTALDTEMIDLTNGELIHLKS